MVTAIVITTGIDW